MRRLRGRDGASVCTVFSHRNKRNLPINFCGPRGLELTRGMSGTANVPVEDSNPGVIRERG